jgi:hypothetical protein
VAKAPAATTDDIKKPVQGDPAMDVAPPPDDDVEEGAEEAPQPRAARKREDEPAPVAANDPGRDEITRLYREKRDQERAEAKAAPVAAADDAADDVTDEPAADAAKPAESTSAAAAADDDGKPADNEKPAEITLIVDGKPVKKNLSEIVALAQTTVAADNRLDEAKRLLKDAQALRASAEHPPQDGKASDHDRSPTETKPENQPADAISREQLDRIVERIQVGDKEEGSAALGEFVSLVNANRSKTEQVTPEQIGALVQQQLFQHQTTQEIDGALKDFGGKYPEIAKDKDFMRVGFDRVAEEFRNDLKAVGLSDEDLKPFGNDPNALATAHRHARMQGLNVRPYGEILTSVGEGITAKFNLRPKEPAPGSDKPQPRPAPASTTVNDRLAAKRAAPQQPRTAGARTPAPQPPRPKTAREKVEEMRVQRGFAPTS